MCVLTPSSYRPTDLIGSVSCLRRMLLDKPVGLRRLSFVGLLTRKGLWVLHIAKYSQSSSFAFLQRSRNRVVGSMSSKVKVNNGDWVCPDKR